MNYLYYLFILLLFFSVVVFLEGIYLEWNTYKGPEAKRIKRRLQAMSAGANDDNALMRKRLLSKSPYMERILLQIPRVHQLDRIILQSGLNINVAEFIGLILGVLVVVAIIAMMMGLPTFVVALICGASAFIPVLYILSAKQKRINLIEQQIPDALDLIGRALMAGHAFPSALLMVGTEMSEPISSEFRIVSDEINYGISSQEALINLATRVPSTDLSYFVVAVVIQRETGGNLAELLSNISRLIRERLKLLATVRVLSAEGRLSAWILTLLPFVIGFALQIMNPKFLSVLWTDPVGIKMVGLALALMGVGVLLMWRIAKIRI